MILIDLIDSCFDGEKTSGEEDVDCGGPCKLKCPSKIFKNAYLP